MYGKLNSLCKCFVHWSNLGIFEKLSSESYFSELSIDITYVKAHKVEAGRTLTSIRLSRGGKTSRVHVAVDKRGRPRKIILTAGNVKDCDVAYALSFKLKYIIIIADSGYSTFATFARQSVVFLQNLTLKILGTTTGKNMNFAIKLNVFFGHLRKNAILHLALINLLRVFYLFGFNFFMNFFGFSYSTSSSFQNLHLNCILENFCCQ